MLRQPRCDEAHQDENHARPAGQLELVSGPDEERVQRCAEAQRSGDEQPASCSDEADRRAFGPSVLPTAQESHLRSRIGSARSGLSDRAGEPTPLRFARERVPDHAPAPPAPDRGPARARARDAPRARRLRHAALRLPGRRSRPSRTSACRPSRSRSTTSSREADELRRARRPRRPALRHPGGEGRGGLAARGTTTASCSGRSARCAPRSPASCCSPTCASASTRPTATAACSATARSTNDETLDLLARTASATSRPAPTPSRRAT